MGFFSSLFGKRTLVDKVPPHIRRNAEATDQWMTESFPKKTKQEDFTFEYLYTHCEPIDQSGKYGSVVYIRIESPTHEHVSNLPIGFPAIETSIDGHQKFLGTLPAHLSKEDTRFLYFSMAKVFRAC